VQREAAWRKSMQMPGSEPLSEADVRSSDTVMGLRGEDHAIWLVATNDKSPDALAMISSYMENDSYREAFKGAIEDFYAKSQNSPESIQSLDETTDFVVPLVMTLSAGSTLRHWPQTTSRMWPSQSATGKSSKANFLTTAQRAIRTSRIRNPAISSP